MSNYVLHQVLELLERKPAPSRNQGEAAFNGPCGRRVHHLFRLYYNLLLELERAAGGARVRVTARPQPGGLMIELNHRGLAYQRRCLVPPPLDVHFKTRLAGLGLS